MPASNLQTVHPDDLPATVHADARQLITDLRDAACDARQLANRYAELLKQTVDVYCVEFEKRADDVLARLEQQQ